jgi:hypothetical protein
MGGGGATIVPRSLKTKRNRKFFQDRPNFFFFIIYDPLLIIDFPKFNPFTVTGMALCVNLKQKMSNFIPLSLRLSRIEFSLV